MFLQNASTSEDQVGCKGTPRTSQETTQWFRNTVGIQYTIYIPNFLGGGGTKEKDNDKTF